MKFVKSSMVSTVVVFSLAAALAACAVGEGGDESEVSASASDDPVSSSSTSALSGLDGEESFVSDSAEQSAPNAVLGNRQIGRILGKRGDFTVEDLLKVPGSPGRAPGELGVMSSGVSLRLEDFESSTVSYGWEPSQAGDGVVGYDVNMGVAYHGRNNGWLYVGNGWAANRFKVDFRTEFYHRNSCGIQVMARAVGAGAQVGIQLWNPNGWTVIAQAYRWINGNGAGYQQIYVDGLNLSSYTGAVYVQVIYGNTTGVKQFIRIDDAQMWCQLP